MRAAKDAGIRGLETRQTCNVVPRFSAPRARKYSTFASSSQSRTPTPKASGKKDAWSLKGTPTAKGTHWCTNPPQFAHNLSVSYSSRLLNTVGTSGPPTCHRPTFSRRNRYAAASSYGRQLSLESHVKSSSGSTARCTASRKVATTGNTRFPHAYVRAFT